MASACASSLSARVAFKATAVQAKSSKAAAPVRAVQVVKADAEATLSTRRSALAAFSVRRSPPKPLGGSVCTRAHSYREGTPACRCQLQGTRRYTVAARRVGFLGMQRGARLD
jgi:hypothetical protein